LTFGGEVLSPVYHLQRQLAAERRRQAGWRTVCASSGKPEREAAPGGELVHGPRGAHLEPHPAELPALPEPFVPACCAGQPG
jgi:hypothetical protein